MPFVSLSLFVFVTPFFRAVHFVALWLAGDWRRQAVCVLSCCVSCFSFFGFLGLLASSLDLWWLTCEADRELLILCIFCSLCSLLKLCALA